jgi:hypothetical protein
MTIWGAMGCCVGEGGQGQKLVSVRVGLARTVYTHRI